LSFVQINGQQRTHSSVQKMMLNTNIGQRPTVQKKKKRLGRMSHTKTYGSHEK